MGWGGSGNDERPGDMADFVEYVNGAAESEWGRRRVLAGHPLPYRLKHLELGNEERVDEQYYVKFEAKAIWAKDPEIILVVRDFVCQKPIEDPMKISEAVSGITSLEAQRKILELGKAHGREVWFDVHIWSENPREPNEVRVAPTYVRAMEKLAGGARADCVFGELAAAGWAE